MITRLRKGRKRKTKGRYVITQIHHKVRFATAQRSIALVETSRQNLLSRRRSLIFRVGPYIVLRKIFAQVSRTRRCPQIFRVKRSTFKKLLKLLSAKMPVIWKPMTQSIRYTWNNFWLRLTSWLT